VTFAASLQRPILRLTAALWVGAHILQSQSRWPRSRHGVQLSEKNAAAFRPAMQEGAPPCSSEHALRWFAL
jgi:hypothetical protein